MTATFELEFVGPSPNRTEGRSSLVEIVIHWWGNPQLYRYPEAHDQVVQFLTAKRTENPSSAHAVISEGRVTEIVEIDDVAWHAGNWSENLISVGYELQPFDEWTPREELERIFETAAAYLALVWRRAQALAGRPLRMHKEFKGTQCPGAWEHLLPALFTRTQQLLPFVDASRPGVVLEGAPALSKELFMQNPFVGRVTSEYGNRTGGFHAGIDIAPPVAGTVGGPVYAAYAGVVEKVVSTQKLGDKTSPLAPGRTGNGVVIRNPDGERQVYNHVTPAVKVGAQIAKGALIGRLDRSGSQTGPHLHFEIWSNGDPGSHRDPRVDFRASKVAPGVGAPTLAGRQFLPLVPDGLWGHRTITELERALARAELYKGEIEEDHGREAVAGALLWSAYQQLLNGWGVYTGSVDGDFGGLSIKAEQTWLKQIGFYEFGIDGNRGSGTISGLQRALNAGRVARPVPQPVEPPKPVEPTLPETPVEPDTPVEPEPPVGVDVDQLADAVAERVIRRIGEKLNG